MASGKINVNKADINLAPGSSPDMPLDVMGLFFFAYRDFVGDADALLERQNFGRMAQGVAIAIGLGAALVSDGGDDVRRGGRYLDRLGRRGHRRGRCSNGPPWRSGR